MPNKPSREIVAENVRHQRELRGLTQEALAELVGRNQSRIAEIERGKHEISTARIDQLADAFGVPSAVLLMPAEALVPAAA